MIVNHSYALKQVKKEIGQVNHYLITILVGLNGIIPHDLDAGSELHAVWNPKCKKASVDRSRLFAQKATLAFVVDCIDMYLRLINRSPLLISNESLKNELDKDDNSKSVYRRLNIICKHLNIDSLEFAMADLLICWRNRLVHFDADNDISSKNREIMLSHFSNMYCEKHHLDFREMLRSFDSKSIPKFKEITSLVNATINLLYQIDSSLINQIGFLNYADRIVVNYFRSDPVKRLNNVFSKEPGHAEKAIRQILLQYGFAVQEVVDHDTGKIIKTITNEVDDYCATFAEMSYSHAKQYLKLGTFINSQ